MQRAEFKIVICGSGLAGLMTALALEGALGPMYQIVLIDDGQTPGGEIIYGSVTAPTAYDFLRGLGLDEPTLFSRSATSFSFGTQYVAWPGTSADWVQCHHQILPALGGVPLQHHLTRTGLPLAPLLISDVAARQGRFAHPPEDSANPLSRAEYGYQFSPREWAFLLAEKAANTRINRISSSIASVAATEQGISELVLSSGETVTADLFVDCTGTTRQLMSALSATFATQRSVALNLQTQPAEQLGPACRRVQATADGWMSQTFLQNAIHTLSVQAGENASEGQVCALGSLDAAWQGNAVAIGAAASAQDPLTPGPMVMLQRDIERLLDLVPVSADFAMEQREFNRRFKEDTAHTHLFAAAFYRTSGYDTPFWSAANAAAQSPDLERKLVQFESRGILAKYDLEPFNDEDWTILHHGMGRRAARYDLQAEALPETEIRQQLDGMSRAIQQLAARMPPHHLYVANMKRYFEKQKHV